MLPFPSALLGRVAAANGGGGGGGGSGTAPIDPATIFTAGTLGVWYKPSDPASMWQDAGRTVAAVVDSPVWVIDDKSGNGRHLSAINASRRPILRSAAGRSWLEYDGVDDSMSTGGGLSWASESDWMMGVETADASFIAMYEGYGGSKFFGLAASGDGAGVSLNVGTPLHFVDGSQIQSETRSAFYSAIGGVQRVIEAQTLSLSLATLGIGQGYGGYEYGGKMFGCLICPVQSTATRAGLRAWMAAEQGRTL